MPALSLERPSGQAVSQAASELSFNAQLRDGPKHRPIQFLPDHLYRSGMARDVCPRKAWSSLYQTGRREESPSVETAYDIQILEAMFRHEPITMPGETAGMWRGRRAALGTRRLKSHNSGLSYSCVPQPSVFVAATSTNNSKWRMPDCSCRFFRCLCTYFRLQAASQPAEGSTARGIVGDNWACRRHRGIAAWPGFNSEGHSEG